MSEEDHPVVPHEMSQLVKGIGAAPDRPFIGLGIQGLNDMAHTLHLEGGGIARRWRRRGLAPRRLMGGKPGGGGFCQEYGEAQEAQFGRRCPQRMEWRFQNTAFGKGMRIWIHLRIVGNDDSVISEDEIPQLDKGCDRLEAIGLSLAGTKAVLANTRKGWSRRRRLRHLDQCRDCGFRGCRPRSKW